MSGDPSKIYHLTKLGVKQAEKASEELKEVPLNIIFTSEFQRTKDTGKVIGKNHSCEIKIDKRLNDFISGMEDEGYHKYLKIREEISETKNLDLYDVRINDGESFNEEKERVWDFLNDLKEKDYKVALIVAHQDTLVCIKGHCDNLTSKEMNDFEPGSGKVYKFEV